MRYPESTFYVSLSDSLTPRNAYDILDALANDEKLRARVEAYPRDTFRLLGVDFGYDVAPTQVRLPSPDELNRALETIRSTDELQFYFEPFGAYVPGQRPFIALLLLASLASV